MVLVVDVGGVQRPVRVARQQRLPRGRAAPRQHPVVAPGVRHVHPVHRFQALAQLIQRVRAGALVHAAGRDDDQVAGLVAGQRARRLLRPKLAQEPGPPQLSFEAAHHNVAHLEDGQRVPGLPRLGRASHQPVLRRQRRGRGNEGVDPGGVGVQHGPRLGVQFGVVPLRRGAQLEAPHGHVLLYRARPGVLGPAARGPAPVVLHLPQPVLRRHEALGEERIVHRPGPCVRDAVAVSVHLDRPLQPREAQRAGGLRQCSLQLFSRHLSNSHGCPPGLVMWPPDPQASRV